MKLCDLITTGFIGIAAMSASAVQGVSALDQIKSPVKILLLRDPNHGDLNIRRWAAQRLSSARLSDNQFNCLFVEWFRDSNLAIADYLENKKSYHDTIDAERDRIFDETGSGTFNLLPQLLLDAARSSGVAVYGVDIESTSTLAKSAFAIKEKLFSYATDDPPSYDNAFHNAPAEVSAEFVRINDQLRNESMAEAVHRRFNSGVCIKAVFVIGADHTNNEDHGNNFTPIQDLLMECGRSIGIEELIT
jgi:hypothetical protein